MKRIKDFVKKILLVDEGPKPLFSRKLLTADTFGK